MAVQQTPKWQIPYPDGDEQISLGDDSIKNVALAVDDHTKLQIGTFAGRPTAAAAKAGKYYLVSDMPGYLYLSDGSNWVEVAPGAGSVLVGGCIDYGGVSDPPDTRYMLCDGRAISRTTYQQCYTSLGGASSPWGQGDGSTTFNIPDCRGRAGVAPDNMGTAQGAAGRLPSSNRALGQSGGAGKVKLTGYESGVNPHNHGGVTNTNGAHNHGGATGGMNTNQGHSHSYWQPGEDILVLNGPGVTVPLKRSAVSTGVVNLEHLHAIASEAAHGHGIDAAAAVAARDEHENMPPYIVMNKLIRVA